MHTIPGCPPHYNGPGVYVLAEPETRRLYIGSSTKIRQRLTRQRTQEHIGWTQKVLPLPSADPEQLRGLEAQTIRRAQAKGLEVTNAVFAGQALFGRMQGEKGPLKVREDRKLYTVGGVSAPLTFWMATHGCRFSIEAVLGRLKLGWAIETALTTPLQKRT